MSEKPLVPAQEHASAYLALRPVLQRFIDGVAAGEKPTDVVKRLRPNVKYPHVLASRWMARPDVKAARAEIDQNAVESVGITRQMIVRELGRIALTDRRKLFDEHGNPLPVHELDEDTAALIAGIEVIDKRVDDKVVKRKTRYRLPDKREALRDLAELAGMRKGESSGGDTIFNIQINL